MEAKFYMVIWDTDIPLDDDQNLFWDYTARTVDLIIQNGSGLNSSSNMMLDLDCFRREIEQSISDACQFLTSQMFPSTIKLLVCQQHEFLSLSLYNKKPIIFAPRQPMTIDDVEDWIIRASLLQSYDRLTQELDHCLNLMNRQDGIESEEDIETLRQKAINFYNDTQIRWGENIPPRQDSRNRQKVNWAWMQQP